ISPPKTTSTPRPVAAGAAATLTASTRFAGPSAPGAVAGRIAPVKTIGASASCRTSHSIAVSSSVSVPCVTTTPMPRRLASRAARQIVSWSAAVRCALGLFISVRASRPSNWSSPVVPATIASASRSGWAPPLPVIPMVPPAERIRTRRAGSWRSGDIAGILSPLRGSERDGLHRHQGLALAHGLEHGHGDCEAALLVEQLAAGGGERDGELADLPRCLADVRRADRDAAQLALGPLRAR